MHRMTLGAMLQKVGMGQRELARAVGGSSATINRMVHGYAAPLKGWGELKANLESILLERGAPAPEVSALVRRMDEQWQASRHHAEAVARARSEGASVENLPSAGRPRHLSTDKGNCRLEPAPKTGQELSEEELMLLSKQSLTPQARKHFKLFRDPWDDPHLPEEVFLTPESRYVYEAMMSAARHGNFLAVIGESGSGKTTLRRMMLEQLKGKGLSGGLREGRTKMLDAVAAFVSISGEQYGSKVGGEKGNVTLHSYDGSLKVQRAMQDRITFDERLQAARTLINECLRDWSEGANANLRAIVDAAWETDRDGNVSTSRILGLRAIKVKDDERWDQAMKALTDSMQVVYSKSFIRVYEKDAYGEFQPIPLDIAKV